MVEFERIYNVPLSDAYLTTRVKATKRAMVILRKFIKRHAKVDEKNIKVSSKLNQYVWFRGRKKPPRHVKIKVIKDNGIAKAYLHDEKIEEKKPVETKKEEPKATEESKAQKQKVETAAKTEKKEQKENEEKTKSKKKTEKAETEK